MKTALAYSGAGANIIIEVGFAKAFRDLGMSYDFINGSSSGAIISAFVHASQLDVLEQIVLTARDRDVFNDTPWELFGAGMCLLDNSPLRKLLQEKLDCNALRKAGKSCIANVSDLGSATVREYELTTLDDADLIQAIIMSTSIPLAFAQTHGLVDGGVLRNYPLLNGLAEKADRVIVFVPNTFTPAEPTNIKDLIGAYVSASLTNQLNSLEYSLQYLKANAETYIVQMTEPTGIGLLDFDGLGSLEKRQAYIELGYQTALKALKK